MSKPSKQHKSKPKTSTTKLKEAHHAASKQLQAAKKRSKAQARITRSQAADVAAQINGEFAQVQSLYVKVNPEQRQTQDASIVPESSVQDLADVMRGL
ncbi:hypothetical protein BV20DRAFT_1051912 [Pilatotrama ljubarskyi]|nr:hypothetical protein BV20DRAFT_1051912 [Pilatotrama ljubarskyi]